MATDTKETARSETRKIRMTKLTEEFPFDADEGVTMEVGASVGPVGDTVSGIKREVE